MSVKSNQFSWNYPGAQGTEFSVIKHIVFKRDRSFKKNCVVNSTTNLIVDNVLSRFLFSGVTILGDDFSSNICKVDSAEFSTTSVDDVLSNTIIREFKLKISAKSFNI